ncbi:bifunctional phosphoribosyl-AMP cyclohydrolase/phosphoribosyl-ATP diphosphatase HisIE [Dehalococcoidia bacterium]|nr:bifunctional phosphoribosyl-AMP cyclohydrolase/phosphoribosyl-ATP diphosphatase HisIE [Dehalococcoidia bacterium]
MGTIQLDDKGLAPVICQDATTGEILMLAYVNPGALKRTLEGGEVWFYSRSRSELWHKGEVSGNYMRLTSATMDCDGDAILLKVEPDGPVCHTGNPTCFFTSFDELPDFDQANRGPGVLEELFSVIQERKQDAPDGSYTAELFKEGVDRIAQKVIEEAGEVAIAGTKEDRDQVVRETSDLLYHALVLLAAVGVRPEDVWSELRIRRG